VGDFPRGWALYVSRDGIDWGTAVAHGRGTGQLTTIDVPRGQWASVRQLRVVLTSAAPAGWSVADLRVYG
jgi:beta-glucosidase